MKERDSFEESWEDFESWIKAAVGGGGDFLEDPPKGYDDK